MKNNQFEILTNLIHDIANQFAIKKIDEDVLFHSIIAYDNLGVTNLFGVLGIELKELIILSNKILSEKEKGQPSYRFNKKIKQVLSECENFVDEKNIDFCFVVLLRSLLSLEYSKIVKDILKDINKEEILAKCDEYLTDELEDISLFYKPLSEDEEDSLKSIIQNLATKKKSIILNQQENDPILSSFGENLNIKARNGEFDNLIQFNDVLDELATILCKQKKPNAILIGPAGGGKTSNVELLAKKIEDGTAPELLLDKVIYTVNLSDMVAGTQYRGQFEQRLKDFTDRAKRCSNLILFIDEIHTLVGAGGTRENELDASNILKPALARGEISCIGATTISEYNKVIKRDSALDRRFERIIVNAPSSFKMQEIVPKIVSFYEKFHSTKYSKEFVENLIPMCEKYMPNRFYPDKAIDVIDYCGALAKVNFWKISPEIKELAKMVEESGDEKYLNEFEEKMNDWGTKVLLEESEVTIDVLRAFFNKKINFLYQQENIPNLSEYLSETMTGQKGAIGNFIKKLKMSSLGLQALNPNKAPSVFCIHGERSNGRSFFCSSVANFIKMNNGLVLEYNGIEFDGADKVISADLDGNSLAQKISISPNCVVVIDDFNKINDSECSIAFRQIFKEGRIRKKDGEISDFSNVVFVISTPSIESVNLGFASGNTQEEKALISKEINEFISYQIKLDNLTKESLKKIAEDSMKRIKSNLAEKGIKFDFSIPKTVNKIAEEAFLGKNKIKTLENKINEFLKEKELI
jgi:ATP-dependent Clp protease ATP-binding subunit ClpC